ncbi:DegT/DnrJ/EryC1/StrS family aminotransferase [Verrucomicrobiota bacterium]
MIEYENLRKVNEKFSSRFRTAFEDFLLSGCYVLGENVNEFEREFADYLGVKHCIGVASGLDALVLGLEAMAFEKGSEVIVPANTYIASILAIVRAGLKPVLVEPDISTYNITAENIKKKINTNTKAIMVVHMYGKSCDMNPIINIAHNDNLKIIEDVAQAHGASYKGRKTGTFGLGCFSFYPTKNLGGLGDGGAVVCNDRETADKVRKLRNYGSGRKYYNELIGFNSRLDEIQACFLRIKLKELDKINEHKRSLAEIYFKHLNDHVIKPVKSFGFDDVYHIYNIRHPDRARMKQFLLGEGIETEVHYPVPPHYQKSMKSFINEKFPISEEIHATTLSLPVSFFHTEREILRVCEVVNDFDE